MDQNIFKTDKNIFILKYLKYSEACECLIGIQNGNTSLQGNISQEVIRCHVWSSVAEWSKFENSTQCSYWTLVCLVLFWSLEETPVCIQKVHLFCFVKVSLCNSNWPWTYYVAQVGLKLVEILICQPSPVLGL